jgi:hypothetical protein
MALLIVAGDPGKKGAIKITATSEGLVSARTAVDAR